MISFATALIMLAGAAGAVHGTVRDPHGAAVVDAQVSIVCAGDRREATTNRMGEFSVTGLPETGCTITADAALFEAQTLAVDLSRRLQADVVFVLAVQGFATRVVVTPARGIEGTPFRMPESVSVLTRAQIDSRPSVLLAQTLREEVGVLLQQTTTSQTSPIIRGFTGQSNVHLIDGVRFNNAAWRSGPNQYTAWIANGVADRVEVVRGSGSVQYGSDALGGTVNVLTRRPSLSGGGLRVGGDADAVFGTADSSRRASAGLQVTGRGAAFRIGGNSSYVGDLRPGGGIDSHAAMTRFLGLPSTTLYSRLPDSGFDQTGAHVIGQVRAGSSGDVHVTYMHENQTGASRYDRIAGGEGLYRSGFAPQTLDFGLVRYRRRLAGAPAEWAATFSLNRQQDGRFEQARPTAVLDTQEATTTVLGYQLEGRRQIGVRHQLAGGAEYYDERIDASRQRITAAGAAMPNRPDIPDGTRYATYGTFAQAISELIPGRVSVRGGVRYGRYRFATTAEPRFGVTAERVETQAFSFSAGAVVNLTPQLNAVFNAGRGFRAANAADLGSVGLTGGGGFEIAPSQAGALGGLIGTSSGLSAQSTGRAVPQLRPEVVYSFEPGLRFRSERFAASVTAFDLEYLDSIQRRAIAFTSPVVGAVISGYEIVRQSGAGLAYIGQDVRPIVTRVNVEHARIVGVEAEAEIRLARRWTARAYYSMANGRLLDTREFMRRMPPSLGGAAVKWAGDGTWIEAAVTLAGTQTRLNSGDLTDGRIGGVRTAASIAGYFNGTATDLGLVQAGILVPTGETLAEVQRRMLGTATTGYLQQEGTGYAVLGLRAGWRLSPAVDLIAIGENLTDRNYRPYGSGVDGPGINLQLRARYRF